MKRPAGRLAPSMALIVLLLSPGGSLIALTTSLWHSCSLTA